MLRPEVFLKRIEKVREAMIRRKVEGIVITNFEKGRIDIRYLTGFKGSFATCVLTQDSQVFMTDPRYAIQSTQEVHGWDIRVANIAKRQTVVALTAEVIKELGIPRVGILGYEDIETYRKLRREIRPNKLVLIANVLQEARAIKGTDEITALRKSIDEIEQVLSYVYTLIHPGVSDRELAIELRIELIRRGIDISFDPIIVSGHHSAIIHGNPFELPEKKIARGDIIQFGVGCMVDRYASDISRVAVCGTASEKQIKMHRAVLRTIEESLKLYIPGILMKKAAQKANEVLESMGFPSLPHGLGHGLGMDVHEELSVGLMSKKRFEVGQVLSVEPGIYEEGYGGMRIERDILIKDDLPEPLDTSSCELKEIKV